MVRRRLKPTPRQSVLTRDTTPTQARRNLQDATLRNVRASKARDAKLETRIARLEAAIGPATLRQLVQVVHEVSQLRTTTENNTRAIRVLYQSTNFRGRKR